MSFPQKIRLGLVSAALLVLVIVGALTWTSPARTPQPTPAMNTPVLLPTVDRGISLEDLAKQQKKITELETQIEVNKTAGTPDITLLLQLGNVYYGIGELTKSIEIYDRILADHPTDAPALENKGQSALEMGDYKVALESWKAAIAESPYELTYIRIADLVRDHIPAQQNLIGPLLEEAIQNLGQTPGLLSRLGQWYAEQGKFDEALSHYEVALRLDPQNDALKQLIRELRVKQVSEGQK